MTKSPTKAPHGSPSFHSSSLERSEWIMWKKMPVCVFFIGGISGISLLNVPPCSLVCFCWVSARQGSNNLWWVVTGRQRDHCLEMKRRGGGGVDFICRHIMILGRFSLIACECCTSIWGSRQRQMSNVALKALNRDLNTIAHTRSA